MPTTASVSARLVERLPLQWEPDVARAGLADLPPARLVLAALVRDYAEAAVAAAAKRGVRLDEVRLVAEADFADDDGEPEGVRMRVEVASPSDEALVTKVFDLAAEKSSVARLLVFEPDVVLVHNRAA